MANLLRFFEDKVMVKYLELQANIPPRFFAVAESMLKKLGIPVVAAPAAPFLLALDSVLKETKQDEQIAIIDELTRLDHRQLKKLARKLNLQSQDVKALQKFYQRSEADRATILDELNKMRAESTAEHAELLQEIKETKEIATGRLETALTGLRDALTPWLYRYACALSGKLGDRGNSGLRSSVQFRQDISLLEDVFGIAVFAKNGERIRGTGRDAEDILQHPMYAQSVELLLREGLEAAKEVDRQCKKFPSLLDNVSEQVADIALVSDWINERLRQLEKWERLRGEKSQYCIEFSPENIDVRHNLRILGARVLDVLMAIDRQIEEPDAPLVAPAKEPPGVKKNPLYAGNLKRHINPGF